MKHKLFDLAIYGGNPSFKSPLYVGRPNIGNRDEFISRINDILDRKWLTNHGQYVQEFEAKISGYLGVKHCIAVNNATIGLGVTIQALGLTGEVIIPSFTFIATAHSLYWQGIKPVFCDVDPGTHNLDPKQVEKLITPRTSGILGVHIWGRPCAINELDVLSHKHNIKIIYDAAHAFGCSYKGKMVGNFGNAEVFSFHATKFLNTFEGGIIATNDDDLANKIRLMINFGFSDYDKVVSIGTNGKMSEASAAMGLTNFDCMNDFIAVNYRNYKQYQKELSDIPGIKQIIYNEIEKNNYQYVALEIDEEKAIVSRDRIAGILHQENILVRRYFYPGCHRMEPYNSLFPDAGLQLDETENLVKKTLLLPTGTSISSEDITGICQLLKFIIDHGAEITERSCNKCVRKDTQTGLKYD